MEICRYEPSHEWDKHCEEQERELAKYPACAICKNPILTDYCYDIDGGLICEDCLTKHYMVETPVED